MKYQALRPHFISVVGGWGVLGVGGGGVMAGGVGGWVGGFWWGGWWDGWGSGVVGSGWVGDVMGSGWGGGVHFIGKIILFLEKNNMGGCQMPLPMMPPCYFLTIW